MFFTPTDNGLICSIKVIPNASKSALGEILHIDSGKEILEVLKVYVKAPAIEGKANQALISFLTKTWQLKQTQIKVIKGTTQPYKTLLILGDAQELLIRLGQK